MRPVMRLAALGVLALFLPGCGGCGGARLKGSGSTFVKPIMDKWISLYEKQTGERINYQAQGSGAGVNQMIDKAVHFGCTDAYLTRDQLKKAAREGGDVVHIPLVLGAIVPVYNLKDADDKPLTEPLNFTGEVLAGIFYGDITNWQDPKIAEHNKHVKLPNLPISVVRRSDKSGSTAIFTEYLSVVSPKWKQEIGSGTSVKWHNNLGIGEGQTSGVVGSISKNPGSIGYVELYYALLKKGEVEYGKVEGSRKGKFVLASLEGVSATAAARESFPEDLRYSLIDPPPKSEDAYPISGTTWAVVYVKQPPDRARALVDFFTWVTHDGQKEVESMHYAKLPDRLVKLIDEKLKRIHDAK